MVKCTKFCHSWRVGGGAQHLATKGQFIDSGVLLDVDIEPVGEGEGQTLFLILFLMLLQDIWEGVEVGIRVRVKCRVKERVVALEEGLDWA